MSLEQELNTIGRQARAASNALRSLSRRVKDAALIEIAPVSYTHLDVYKRQPLFNRPGCGKTLQMQSPRLHIQAGKTSCACATDVLPGVGELAVQGSLRDAHGAAEVGDQCRDECLLCFEAGIGHTRSCLLYTSRCV